MGTEHLSAAGPDPEVLQGIHRAALKALAELHRVCEELGIRYAVYGGTAIGAVRHGGFIPWDDDADVCMPRDDYERLLDEAPTRLRPGFKLLEPRTTPSYPQTFAVLGLEGTQFVSQAVRNRPFRMPIGVDVFPLDTMPEEEAAYRRQARATWLWGRLLFLLGTPSPTLGLPTPLRQGAGAVMLAVHWVLRGARVSPRRLQGHWERAARRYEHAGTGLLGDYSTRDPRHWSVREDELFPAELVPFEDIVVRLPRQADQVLRRGYGDYLQLPPESERVGHQPYHIDFGPHGSQEV